MEDRCAQGSTERGVVAYVGLRPPGGPTARLLNYIAVGSGLALIMGTVVPHVLVVGIVGLIASVPVGLIQFVGRGIHQAGLIRRFDPYRDLHAPAPGAVFRGTVEYREQDHLGCVLYWSGLPTVGDAFLSSRAPNKLWRDMNRVVQSHGLVLPRTLASDALHAKLAGIPLTRDLLEPEYIGKSRAIVTRVAVLIGGFYLVGGLFMLRGNNWPTAVMYTMLASSFLLVIPRFRRAWRKIRWEHDAPKAGCGVLVSGGRRWTCADSVMLVQDTVFSGGILVTIVGEAGEWAAGYSGTDDEDFVNLWQRWNHLDPKPELLTAG